MTGVMGVMRVRGASKDGEGGGEEEGKDEQTNKGGDEQYSFGLNIQYRLIPLSLGQFSSCQSKSKNNLSLRICFISENFHYFDLGSQLKITAGKGFIS